jgi:hypothetical protein
VRQQEGRRRSGASSVGGASQRIRKRVEEIFGWLKTVAFLTKSHHRRQSKVGWVLTFAIAAYNLVRMRNLAMETPA